MKNELLLIVLLNNAPQISCKQQQNIVSFGSFGLESILSIWRTLV